MITDIEVLARDYKVPGAEWYLERGTGIVLQTRHLDVLDGIGWRLSLGVCHGTPPSVAYVAFYCAVIGRPTPQALAREVMEAIVLAGVTQQLSQRDCECVGESMADGLIARDWSSNCQKCKGTGHLPGLTHRLAFIAGWP